MTHTTTLRTAALIAALLHSAVALAQTSPRERINIDNDWRFIKGDPADNATLLTYQVRPPAAGRGRGRGAPATTSAPATATSPASAPATTTAARLPGIYPWILPTGNDFIADPDKHHDRPEGNLGDTLPYTSPTFSDASWRTLNLPHDFAIEGPFVLPNTPGTDGATGRLPFFGVAWYRKHLTLPAADAGKQLYLDIDGAMSYATVWLNGKLVGGWPYGYASFRLDLTPYAKPGQDNLLAIRLDNPPNSSRWYPGAGIYRNVWLTKTSPVHVAQWGTYVTTPAVSPAAATIDLKINLDNNTNQDATVTVATELWPADEGGHPVIVKTDPPPTFDPVNVKIPAGQSASTEATLKLSNPKLWSPAAPNRYVALTTVSQNGAVIDRYETPFGIRTVTFDPNQGLAINGEKMKINGVCNHHDLGALGTAFNFRAAQRQLQMLRDMGCNAIRTSHNPPAPELLDLADQMGFVVMDETFDTWKENKRPNDYALLFNDWHEQDTRALVRRDRNHPSVIMWSIGNEIAEQGRGTAGAAVARTLADIVHQEDPTRPTTAAQNISRANDPFPKEIDALGMNYQGSRPSPNNPQGSYPAFHQSFPDKFTFGSETASTISSRGEYTFPVAPGNGVISERPRGAPATTIPPGQDLATSQVSSYDLYYPNWATSPDTEFTAQDRFPFVGGEFVWTGFDYLGEPDPFSGPNQPGRSSYYGIIDLAGFPKDRFYIYQAHWRPDYPMAHILPHWNWPDRVGQVTPVHVYTSGDEAELFVNGESKGRKKKEPLTYRLRWDDVVYQPGALRVVAYKNGKEWATDTVKTTGPAAKLLLKPDRPTITADGHDLSFVTLTVADADGLMVPRSKNLITFEITGPGEIAATDNGDPTDLTMFSLPQRKAFNGLALAIVRTKVGQPGPITLTAKSDGLTLATTTITGK